MACREDHFQPLFLFAALFPELRCTYARFAPIAARPKGCCQRLSFTTIITTATSLRDVPPLFSYFSSQYHRRQRRLRRGRSRRLQQTFYTTSRAHANILLERLASSLNGIEPGGFINTMAFPFAIFSRCAGPIDIGWRTERRRRKGVEEARDNRPASRRKLAR